MLILIIKSALLQDFGNAFRDRSKYVTSLLKQSVVTESGIHIRSLKEILKTLQRKKSFKSKTSRRYGDYTVMLMTLQVFTVTFHCLIKDSILKSSFL